MDIADEFAQQVEEALEAAPLLLQRLLVGLLVFAIGFLITRLMQRVVVRAVRGTPGGITVERALSRVIAIAGVTLSLLTALATVGVDVGALIAALGLTSLAIGLALKDTIENTITGVLLLIQRPFNVGDIIKVSDVTGTVADVAIRTTNIRTFDGLHVLIPNRHVYNEVITNWTYYPTRRVTVTAGVAYDTDLAHAYRVLSEAVSALPGVLSEPPMLVSFEGFDEISIRMVFRFWFEWRATTAIDLQTRATEAIMEAARHEGISLPVSVRAMVLHNPAESVPEMTTTR